MPDWIKDLKKMEEKQESARFHQERLQLHQAEVIEAKLPQFWEEIITGVESQAIFLEQTFPEKDSYRTAFERTSSGFRLTQTRQPSESIEGRADAKSKTITFSRRLMNNDGEIAHYFQINPDSSEQLYTTHKGSTKASAEDIAKWVIKTLCRIV